MALDPKLHCEPGKQWVSWSEFKLCVAPCSVMTLGESLNLPAQVLSLSNAGSQGQLFELFQIEAEVVITRSFYYL